MSSPQDLSSNPSSPVSSPPPPPPPLLATPGVSGVKAGRGLASTQSSTANHQPRAISSNKETTTSSHPTSPTPPIAADNQQARAVPPPRGTTPNPPPKSPLQPPPPPPPPAPVESPVPEIPGIKADYNLATMLRKEVADMLGRMSTNFPGAQPVSFAARHLEELKRTDYYLCEKSDGIRCLLYFTRDGDKEVHYLIDRKNDYYWVRNLHFPLPGDETFRKFHTETLIDGELVLDNIGGGRRLLRFLVFDCLMLDNQRMMHRMLDKRLGYVMENIYKPYKLLCKTFKEEVKFFPFQVEFKKMEFSYSIQWMFDMILPKLPHGNDGLIFTCRTTPYKCGTDEHIIKWKPVSENSIDFRLNLEFPILPPSSPTSSAASDRGDTPELDWNAMPTFNLSVYMGEETYTKWAQMHVEEDEWEGLKGMGVPLDDAIVECAMDKQGRWRYMRFRKDKKHANHISTVESVMESVKDAVDRDQLVAVQGDVRKAWKMRQAVASDVEQGESRGESSSKRVRR